MEHAECVVASAANPPILASQASLLADILKILRTRLPHAVRGYIPSNVPSFEPVVSHWDWDLQAYVTRPNCKTEYKFVTIREYPEDQRAQHDWWRAATEPHSLHPAVRAIVETGFVPVGGVERIALEYPRRSDDGERLSYVQSEEKGGRQLWTVTAPGKYIKARWPYLRDDYIRDVVAAHVIKEPTIVHTTAEMVEAVQDGPGSCMSWDDCESVHDHPYYVYAPKYGWRMAVRRDRNNCIVSRTLLLHASRGDFVEGETLQDAVFVRSYRRNDSGYSSSDNEIEAWLIAQGARKEYGWPCGVKLRKVDHPDNSGYEFMLPYIDGENHHVDDCGTYLRIAAHGEYCARNTDGGYEGGSERSTCSCCGELARPETDDDGLWVGPYLDEFVGSCCSDEYVYGYGRLERQYYYHQDHNVEVGDVNYHEDFLSDNGVVELADGDHAHLDDTRYCEIRDEYYLSEDCVYAQDRQAYVHQDEAWRCAATDKWYTNDVEPVHTSVIPLTRVYRHSIVHSALYRPGLRGRIDVYHIADRRWDTGTGEPNDFLTGSGYGYVEVPHEQRRFKHVNGGGETLYRFDPTTDRLVGYYCYPGTDEWYQTLATGESMASGLNGFYEIEPDLSFTLTPELETV